jgi:hypothetical protein
MKPSKKKSGEPTLREKLSQKFLEALEADFQLHGLAVLEKMRQTHPERYAELAAKMIMTAEPQQNQEGFGAAKAMKEIGMRLLQSVGVIEPTDEQIEQAIAANDEFIARLEEIRNAAAFGALDNGNRELGGLN